MRDRGRDWMRAGDARRRELRRWVVLSALAHGCLLAVLVWTPRPRAEAALPSAVMVDLVAMAAPSAPAARPAPARATPLPPEPAPTKPQPKPPAPPPPPTAEAVLPKTPQREPEKPKPSPKPEPKPEPEVAKAKPEPAPPSAEKPRPAPEYDDVLASLRAERGETRPERAEPAVAPPVPGGAAGAPVTPEVASWQRAAQMAVRRAWVLPAGFRKQPLETHVTVELDAEGNVLGEPRVTQRSGNPWYDESVARAIQKASPLPRPPEAGSWPFIFCPEERC